MSYIRRGTLYFVFFTLRVKISDDDNTQRIHQALCFLCHLFLELNKDRLAAWITNNIVLAINILSRRSLTHVNYV